MKVTVRLPTALRPYADNESAIDIEVDRPTVAAVIGAIGARYPGVADRTLDDQGQIRRHVNVFVDGENSRFIGGLDAAVANGAEVTILPAVSGGYR